MWSLFHVPCWAKLLIFFMSLLLQTEDIVVFKENPTWSLSWMGLPLSESILIISPRRLLYKELPAKETMLFWGKSFSRHSKVVSTTVFFFFSCTIFQDPLKWIIPGMFSHSNSVNLRNITLCSLWCFRNDEGLFLL